MKHHAKASSAGSIAGRGHGLGSIRSVFAARGASAGATGSGAPSHRLVARLALLVAVALLAVAPSALAATPSRALESSFGSFAAENPQSVAVDQSNGDLYVVDSGNTSVHRYDSAGNPKNFTAGPNAGTNTLTGFSWFVAGSGEVAIDNSGGPANGNIYVASGNGIDVYKGDGTHVTTLTGAETPETVFSYSCGVAVDQSNGDLYVGDLFVAAAWRYTPSSATPVESDYAGGITADFGLCSVAADSGRVYAAKLSGGVAKRYSAADFADDAPAVAGTQIVDEKATAVATDPSSGDLYVDEGERIAVFDSTDAPQYTFGAGDFGANSNGVAVMGSGGKAYVSDRANGRIAVYGPVELAIKPSAITKAATAIGADAATLNALVNPNSALITDCHFEYVDDAGFEADGFTGAQTAPCVPDPGSGTSSVAVSAAISGLASGTTYHYRIFATSSVGTKLGDSLTLTTLPIAITDQVTNVTHHTNATLKGHLELHGDPGITNCQFDWGTTTAYGNTTDCAEGDSFTEPAEVSAFINNLTPGTQIHYRLHLTTTTHGEALGRDRSFKPDVFPFVHELTATVGSAGAGAGQLSTDTKNPDGSTKAIGASGVAVDQASGEVYVADTGNHRVVKFDADGNFIAAWGWGVSDSSSAPQICTSFCQAGISGHNPGQFATPRYIAVDNSGGASQGDVYVVDQGPANPTITKFNPSGNVIVAWGTGGQVAIHTGFLNGAVVDSSGRLNFVSGGAALISRLDGATGNLIDQLDGADGVSSIAIEPGGTFLELNGLGIAQRYDPSLPSSAFVNNLYVSKWPKVSKSANDALAVDPANGELYVVAGKSFASDWQASHVDIYRFDLAGNVIEPDGSACVPGPINSGNEGSEGCDPTQTFGAAGDLTEARGIGLNGAAHKAYVTDSGQLKIFSGFTATPPTLTPGDPTALTGTSATLNALVDPEGLDITDCHFSYVDATEFGANGYANATEVPCDPDPGSGSGDVPVSAEVSGLDPAIVYHFRIEASNATEHGNAIGLDQTFTSRGPIVTHIHANPVTATDAVLGATINPQGSPTTYHFDYGPTASYGSSTLESAAIGGTTDHQVSEQIAGLAPATTYHFRIVAKNEFATIVGPDVTFITATAADSCPNAALRTGHGFSLPDCRAYEQASPIDKHGAHALTSNKFAQAATDGSAVTFSATAGLPTTGGESRPYPVLAHRDAEGWRSNGIIPLLPVGHNSRLAGIDLDLTTTVSTDDVSGTLYIGDTVAGTWTSPFSGLEHNPFSIGVPAFSADAAHFLLGSNAVLTPDAVNEKPNLYDYDHGSLTLAGRVPAFPATSCDDVGGPACVVPANGVRPGTNVRNGNLGVPDRPPINTISGDGSRIVFTEEGSGRIYLREDGARTIQVSASQASSPDPNGHKPAAWAASSHDGGTIYFTSCEKLTDDSTAVSTSENKCGGSNQGSDLYSYDADSGALTDLTVDHESDPRGADVRRVLGVSADGSYVYFGANGRLAPAASAGNCNGESGGCELYLVHNGGAPVDLATIGGADLFAPRDNSIEPARVADDGTLLLASKRQLTSHDNVGPTCSDSGSSGACIELYRYHPGDSALGCVSCDPGDAAPFGNVELSPYDGAGEVTEYASTRPITHNLSADGNRVFFNTPDALVPADTNGVADVYEWEANGTGSCDSSAENGGCLYLLSSGTSAHKSYFVDASASGDDVFIRTLDRLVPQDRDDLYDLYDVRVGGGFAYQHAVSPPPCASAEQCHGQGPATPPRTGAGSAAFSGPGSPPVNRKAKKHHKKKRHHKARKHKRSQKRANSNPGGSK